MRTFIAVEIPMDIRERIGNYIHILSGSIRHIKWVAFHNLHFTIKFLGEVDQAQVAKLQDCVAAAAAEMDPFRISLNGLGYFPSKSKPRVLWIGTDGGADSLLEMFQILENHLEKVGIDRETRAFSPHLTIGRARKDKKITVPVDVPEFGPLQFNANSLVLIKSTLTPNGPIYEKQFESLL